MEINKPLFIEVFSVDEMNNRSKEGYEFITIVYKESYMNTVTTNTNFNGNFMGNPIHINGDVNISVPHKDICYLMKLGNVAQVIYGDN